MTKKDKQPIAYWDGGNGDYDEDVINWESFIEDVSMEMKGKMYWRDDATNMGWLNRTGYKVFEAENGLDFIRAISPDTDCHYTFYRHYKHGFRVRLSHHDAPMGEHHIIKPITEKQYEEANA